MANGAPLSGNTNTGSGSVPYPDYMSEMALGRRSKNTIDNLNYADLVLAMQKGNAGQVNPAIREALSSITGQIPQSAPMNPADQAKMNYAPQSAPMNPADQVQMRYNSKGPSWNGHSNSLRDIANQGGASTSAFTSGGDLQTAIQQQLPEKMPIKGPLPTTTVPTVTGGGGGGQMATGVQGFTAPTDQTANINREFDTLEQTVRDEFGNLQTTDFTAQIQDLIEQGRLSLQDLNSQQLVALQEAALRREGQIGDIQTGLEGDLAVQEQYRQDIQQQVADQAAQRAGQMTADQEARIQAAREGLGPQVTSEFEEVAALTGGLTGSQALSTTAGMDRLAQVANQGAAQRLAAPAMLAAEAKMAVGDEKFRLENQLQQQLAAGLAELNMQEQQQVLQEAMRQEQFGIERDQAMANALMNIASQRTGATLGEAQRLEDVAIRQGEILQSQGFQAAEAQKQRDFQAAQAAASRAAARAAEDRRTAAQQEQLDKAISGLVSSADQLYGQDLSPEQAEALISSGMVDAWMAGHTTADQREWLLEQAEIEHQNEMAALEYEAELEARGQDTSPSAQFDKAFPDADPSLRAHALQHWQMSEEDKQEFLDKTYPITGTSASTDQRNRNARADLQNMWAIRAEIHENIKAETTEINPFTLPLGAVDPYAYDPFQNNATPYETPFPTRTNASPKQFQ